MEFSIVFSSAYVRFQDLILTMILGNLYWACLYGHRIGVHANMTDTMVQQAAKSGNERDGYIIEVSYNDIIKVSYNATCGSDSWH